MARPFKVETVHKYMYPATYNFKDEVNTNTGTTIDFVDGVSTAANTTIVATLIGHKKVLKQTGAADYAQHNEGSNYTTGIRELWVNTSDVTGSVQYRLQEEATINIAIRITLSKFRYLDSLSAWQDVGLACVDDTWYHLKFQWYADNTYDLWIDGTQYLNGIVMNNNMVSGISRFYFYAWTDAWMDAYGSSEDTDYAIGDNVYYRHYKETIGDTFEEEDVGTQGTTIAWVGDADTTASVEIVAEFNEHKKVIRQDYTSAVGGYDHCLMHPTQAKDGWCSFWFKVADITGDNQIRLADTSGWSWTTYFGIRASQFQKYTGGAWSQITSSPVPVNDTWYHIYIKWVDAATDTITCWINNIEYETYNVITNQTDGVNTFYIMAFGAGDYIYVDAPIFSTDNDLRGDNRLFDYNDAYTKTDITTDVKNVLYKNEIYKWREAILLSETSYENSEVFFQVYDVNSKLAIEAEIKKREQISKDYTYSLRDKNQDDLEHRSSNIFTADDIHDPTDSTSMLKVILPNVSQADGDLILVNADTKTDTYSPTTQNYSDYEMLRDISDLANSVVIIEANGKCHLDDDLASGTALDLDTVADKDKMTEPPLVTDILEDINYFEIFGAMNPDTGTRFYKIIDNTGDDKKKSWRYTNNAFKNQTDVDAYAAALNNRTTTIKNIKFTAQSIGTHNMGETIDYKFIDALYNVPQANYYVIYEEINFDLNENTIILSEGMIENSKYGSIQPSPENYNDSYAAEIYETDINTVTPEMRILGAAVWSSGNITLAAVGDGIQIAFFLDAMVDDSRDIIITFSYQRNDGGADTVDITRHFAHALCDGANQAWTTVWNSVADTLPADALTDFNKVVFTLPATNLTADSVIYMNWKINEALRFYIVHSCVVRYYIKRSA